MPRPTFVLLDLYGTLGVGDRRLCPAFVPYLMSLSGLSEDAARRVVRAAMAESVDGTAHHDASTDATTYRRWIQDMTKDELARSLPGAAAERVADEFLRHTDLLDAAMRPFPWTPAALTDLRAHGFRLAICSNWSWSIDAAVKNMGLAHLVERSFCSAQLGARKPHPEFFLSVLAQLDADASSCIFVGDTWAADINGARGVGMYACFVGDSKPRDAVGDSHDVFVGRDLRDVERHLRNWRV